MHQVGKKDYYCIRMHVQQDSKKNRWQYLIPLLEEGVLAVIFSETLKNLKQKMRVEQESHWSSKQSLELQASNAVITD